MSRVCPKIIWVCFISVGLICGRVLSTDFWNELNGLGLSIALSSIQSALGIR